LDSDYSTPDSDLGGCGLERRRSDSHIALQQIAPSSGAEPWHIPCTTTVMHHGIYAIDIRSGAMKNWLSKIMRWIEHSETRQLESYLAQSASAADLERRMRDWESKNRGFDQLP